MRSKLSETVSAVWQERLLSWSNKVSHHLNSLLLLFLVSKTLPTDVRLSETNPSAGEDFCLCFGRIK
jgi:hypothetical protein